ncbi:MAG: purine-nucleoside phosphorylase [Proteobacteria bacterium]|nr:purine-nucleoside phosphorylase [Pseudomonadota bacterium]
MSNAAAQMLRATGRRPRIAVLLGSGWAPLAQRVVDPLRLPYASLPGFPQTGIAGHAGELLLGRIGAHEVALLCGRRHAYEGGDVAAMKGAIDALAAAGVQTLVQTNAAGSLDETMRPGELMMLADHLNLVQHSPLVGERGASRFLDLRDAYDPALRTQAREAARRAGITLHEGVYAWVLGPQFETPAEIRMLQRLGAQAVGMSTVPETILARHAGLRVLAFSLFTNMGCGLQAEALSHAHTLAVAGDSAPRAVALLEAVIAALPA